MLRCELVHNGVRAGAVPPQAPRDSWRAARTGSGDRTRDRSCSQSCGARVIPRKRASRRGRIVAYGCTVALGRGTRQDRHARDQDREIRHAIGGRDPDPSGANPFSCPRTDNSRALSVVRRTGRAAFRRRGPRRLRGAARSGRRTPDRRPRATSTGTRRSNQHQRDKEYLDPHVIFWPCPDTMSSVALHGNCPHISDSLALPACHASSQRSMPCGVARAGIEWVGP
jgi:hypothetical protein